MVGYNIRRGSEGEEKHLSSQMEVISDVILKRSWLYARGFQQRRDSKLEISHGYGENNNQIDTLYSRIKINMKGYGNVTHDKVGGNHV